jgi:uncharacterized protein
MLDFQRIKENAGKYFRDAKGSHDWEHTERVLSLAVHLSQVEGANVDLVKCAAVLHDIARGEEDQCGGKLDHAVRGAELAREILSTLQVPPEDIDRIAHCIETHRFRNHLEPQSLEAKVLFDADKLDSIGAVGIGRAFLFAGEVGAKLHNPGADIMHTQPYTEEDTAYREYMVKLRKVKERILTAEGRRLAQERHDFMVAFFERLNREVEGVW